MASMSSMLLYMMVCIMEVKVNHCNMSCPSISVCGQLGKLSREAVHLGNTITSTDRRYN